MIVNEFSEIAGPVLNINKSEIIGTCQYKTLSEIGNIKTTNNANCLGIYMYVNNVDIDYIKNVTSLF